MHGDTAEIQLIHFFKVTFHIIKGTVRTVVCENK